ncbi:MAG: serine/threonine protein kinase, partial [Planctomycetia bacterium]|nr:serine/threonine protein kinase [Planctomycetia bacterium]
MVLPSTETFVETLRACELLDAPQLNELRRTFPAGGDDPRPLARRLMQQGWLTAYQINQLLTGHGHELSLGHYILLERLGEGGMGQVYKARHQKLGRVVALKVMRKDRMTEHDTIRRFQREIQAIAQLSHPNIVMAFDADEVHGVHFFAMEYFEGIDLNRLVRRLGSLPISKACEYIRQAALGLQHAHERGLVHRDVKPSNLLLTKGGPPAAGGSLVKILDMGLARLEMGSDATESSQTLTQRGVIIGTADFIAPEQAMNPHGADIRCDLYSLGCTFYFLLTGQVPFTGGTALEKLFRHRLEPPKPVQELRPDVPDVVADIVQRLLAKAPADRYQTPATLATDLADVRAGASSVQTFDNLAAPHTQRVVIVPGTLEPPPPRKPTTGVRRRSRRWLAAGGGLAFLAVSLTAAVWLLASVIGATPEPRPTTASAPLGRTYLRKPTRDETILATLKANGYPTLDGKWHILGPLPFERDKPKMQHDSLSPIDFPVDLTKQHKGKGGKNLNWREFTGFRLGAVLPLRIFDDNDNAAVFLYHAFDAKEEAWGARARGRHHPREGWRQGPPRG